MTIFVRFARLGSKQAQSLLNQKLPTPAQSVAKWPGEPTRPCPCTTKEVDSPKVVYTTPIFNFDMWAQVKKDLQEAIEFEIREINTKEFHDVFMTGIGNMTMKEASRMLNRNAWKIEEFTLIPAFGPDPETEWSGFVSFIDNPNFAELECHEDDYRDIIKKVALYAELLDLGE